jgi:hypothetical protein
LHDCTIHLAPAYSQLCALCVLLLQVLPDKNPGDKEAATCAFQLMQSAYEALMDERDYGLGMRCALWAGEYCQCTSATNPA